MAVFKFSALSDGQSLVFNPTADVLNFDQTTVAAADLRVTQVGANIRIDVVSGTQAGKDVTLQNVSPLQLATTNVTFADGSKLLFGDDSTAQNDNLANSLAGTAGRDLLQGFGGADTMAGGTGNDTYIVSTGDVLSDTGGVDTVESDVTWALADGFENLTLTGTGNINATGNNATNILVGNSGNNFFNPRGGDDTIQAGAGNDQVTLGGGGVPTYGNKVIDLGAGIDRLDFSGFAKSAIVVDLAAGTLVGGGTGGAGSAKLISIETVVGDAFDDRLSGSGSTESLAGGGGNDTLDGRGGVDTLTGGTGADTFAFSTAPAAGNADQVTDFVSATDKLSFDNNVFTHIGVAGDFNAGDVRFRAGPGFTEAQDSGDRLIYNTTTGQLFYTPEGDLGGAQLVATLQGAPALAATDIMVTGRGAIVGTAGNDSLTGTPGDDSISGLGGNDTIDGLGGRDTIRGGDGDDTLIDHVNGGPDIPGQLLDGGLGNDTYDLRAFPFDGRPPATIVDAGGVDTVLANHDFVLPDGIENLTLFEGLRGTGNAQNNIITTRDSEFGLHQVDAREGNDTIIGGPDRDEMTGGAGNDVFVFSQVPTGGSSPVQSDEIEDFASGADRLQFDNTAFTQLGAAGNFTSGDARFVSGAGLTSGQDASDRLVYDTTNGDLYYDADGNGAGSSVLVAHLTGAPALVATDLAVTGQTQPNPNPIQGTAGNDSLVGTEGNDSLVGLAGDDTLRGLGGDDTLDGGQGNDSLDGGLGNDTYIVRNGESNPFSIPPVDSFADAGGTDTVIAIDTGFQLDPAFENLILRGTTQGSSGIGNDLNNVIVNDGQTAGSNSIALDGRGGDDTLIGGNANEMFFFSIGASGRFGNDSVDGGGGVDTLDLQTAPSAAVTVDMRAGTASTSIGSVTFTNIERVWGGSFADSLTANDSGVGLVGFMGNDTLTGGAGNDELFGDGPDDPARADGQGGNDVIVGGAGNDFIVSGVGDDQADGGTGNDTFLLQGQFAFGNDTLAGGDGVDEIVVNASLGASIDLGAGTLTGGDSQAASVVRFTGIENARVNNATNDFIVGSSGANNLVGGGGVDTINGAGGNDTLSGGSGPTHFVFDQTPGAANADSITDFATGSDKIQLDASAMTALGKSGDFAAGDARFFAAAGATGGHDADDRVIFNTSTGQLFYDADGNGAGAAQLLATLQPGATLAATDLLVVGSSGAPGAAIVGTEGNDTLNGTDGNDTIDGLGGDDVLSGGFGTDLLRGGAGNDRLKDREDSNPAAPDTLDGGLGNDIYDFLANPLRPHTTVIVDAGGVDTVWSNQNFVLPTGIENLTLFEGHSGTGNELDNMMVANGNVNSYTMDGAGGNDTLLGAFNAFDDMRGGAGSDVFAFSRLPVADPSVPLDTLEDFVSGTDSIQLDGTGFANLGAPGRFSATDERFFSAPGARGAHDASDRVIYDSEDGVLSYDPDGTGPAAARQLAFTGGVTLVASDITVAGQAAPPPTPIQGTAGNDSLTGTEGNDTISGLVGNDTINALGGDDTLDGGAGVDNLNGGLGNDTYIVSTGDVLSDTGGVDTVLSDITWTLADGFENLTLTGTGNINATGNNATNILVGNSGNNFFNPRGGDDTIQGGAGNDQVTLGGGGVASYGNKLIDLGAGFDRLDFSGFARSAIQVDLAAGTLKGGGDAGQGSAMLSGIENVVGDAFNDLLSGSAVAESLNGGGGNDTIGGRGGNDTLTGGLSADAFVFDTAPAAGNVDQVTDFISATDRVNFDNVVFTALGVDGNFAAGDARFAAGAGFTAGRDASDRIVYDTTTGNLYYDADGSGTGAAQLVATLQGHPVLAATDITVI